MRPVRITLPNHTKGDTWEGLIIGPVLFNDAQPPFELDSCRLYFRKEGVIGFKYKNVPDVDDGTITIDDSVIWELTVVGQVLPLDVGVWDWDFETTDADGVIRTIYKGTLSIVEEQTYDD